MVTKTKVTERGTLGESGKQQALTTRLQRWIAEALKYSLLIILAVSFALPLFWMFTSALKDDPQVYSAPPVWIPNPAYWNNFWDAWNFLDFNRYAINSLFRYAIPAVLGATFSSAMVAYGFARVRWIGRDVLFFICLSTMMIPFQVRMVPLFIIFRNLDWINSYRPLVVPTFFGNAYFIFLLRQFFRTIPAELSDAARIDGASELGIFWRIILPLVKPALMVVALFQFINSWNNYLGPLIYLNEQGLYPIALAIQLLRSSLFEMGTYPRAYPYLMAVSAVVTAPILILFFVAQRTFIEGISLTGLKG